MYNGEQPFSTSDVILACALFSAGCEPVDPNHPCTNLFDEEILGKLGYRGMSLQEAAEAAWNDEKKGHVQYHLKLTERALHLIRAFREQSDEIEKGEGKAFVLLAKILGLFQAGAIQLDETILRCACVNLKTRGEFVNVWKKMVPLLRIPDQGKAKHFDTTIVSKGKTVEAKGVHRPGMKIVSLNASDKTKKALKL